MVIELSHVLGVLAAAAHLLAYLWYALLIFRSNVVPHAASWFMWLIGAWVEYATYQAIDGGHWSGAALPFICVLGVCLIFVVTGVCQSYDWYRYGKEATQRYHSPKPVDYVYTALDVGAGLGWVSAYITASFANIFAVGTSVLTFIPMWRTVRKKGGERHGPWLMWCLAYVLMLGAVLIESGNDLLERLFYPVYYLLLSGITAYLAWNFKHRGPCN